MGSSLYIWKLCNWLRYMLLIVPVGVCYYIWVSLLLSWNWPSNSGHTFSLKLPRQTTLGNLFWSGPCFAQMYLDDLISQQEDSFVVGTAEGTVFHFQLVSVTSNSSEKQWVRTKPFQHHTHDVRTVAHSPTALISGGGFCSRPAAALLCPALLVFMQDIFFFFFFFYVFLRTFSNSVVFSLLPPSPQALTPT